MLERVWRKGNTLILLVGTETGTATMENSVKIHLKNWKILKETGIPDHLTCLLRTYMQVRKQQLELDMEQQTGSK